MLRGGDAYQPETYVIALSFMVISMLYWGCRQIQSSFTDYQFQSSAGLLVSSFLAR